MTSFEFIATIPTPFGMYSWPIAANSSATCFTNGQWLQINIKTVPPFPEISAKERVRPSIFVSEKSSASVPRGSIVLGVRTIFFSFKTCLKNNKRSTINHFPETAGKHSPWLQQQETRLSLREYLLNIELYAPRAPAHFVFLVTVQETKTGYLSQ